MLQLTTMNRQSTMHQQLESVTDLATLSPVSEDIIVSCIRERFMNDNIYTSIGTSALVAVNPHKYVPSNSDAVLHKYAAEYRDTSPDKVRLPPHIFQLANNAYYHMRRTAQDQSILLTYVSQFIFLYLHSPKNPRSRTSCFPAGTRRPNRRRACALFSHIEGRAVGLWAGCARVPPVSLHLSAQMRASPTYSFGLRLLADSGVVCRGSTHNSDVVA